MKFSKENMNIALVHDWITNIAGAERVLLQISEIYPDAPIYTSVFDKKNAKPFLKKKIKTSYLQHFPFAKSKREVLIPLTPLAFEQFNLSSYDLVISSTTMAAKGILTKPNTVHICYCHTPSRYLWEPFLDSRAKKGWFSGLRQNVMHKMRIWDRLAADRVDFFIANSKYIQKRIKKYYGRDSIVVYPSINIDKFKPTTPDKIGNYFLFVSRLVDYKRCDLVIEAFNDLGLPLRVIGRGPQKKYLSKIAKDNIEFLGYLSDEEMQKYYQEAKAFIFAAEEDFGIVPLEAMASGRPVIAYAAGGLLETVVPGVTGEFFKEQTPQCLINAVKSFKPEKYDSRKIREHATKFSNENFKKEFKGAVDEILENIETVKFK